MAFSGLVGLLTDNNDTSNPEEASRRCRCGNRAVSWKTSARPRVDVMADEEDGVLHEDKYDVWGWHVSENSR